VDLSAVRIEKDRLAGRVHVMLVPDPWVPNDHKPAEVKVAGKPWTVLTLSPTGKHPDLKVQGGTLLTSGRKVSFDGKNVTLAVFKPAR
jgi:hypothetical protein